MMGRAVWRRPKAASILVDADAANIAKTYANAYPIFVYLGYFLGEPLWKSRISEIYRPVLVQIVQSRASLT